MEEIIEPLKAAIRLQKEIFHPLHRTLARTYDLLCRAFSLISDWEHACEQCKNSLHILTVLYQS